MFTRSFLRHAFRLAGIAIAVSLLATGALAAGPALLPAVPLPAPAVAALPAAGADLTADEGVIAYVKRSTGDIHLISPDGANDRVLWTNPDPDHTPISLAWRPDGGELAFSSQHEWQCSLYDGDVYVIRADGSGYRRITNAPACAELAGLPKGSVTVEVQDYFGSSFVYVAGAPGLTRAQSGTMTLDNIADFGPGVLQPSVGIAVLDRVIGREPYADILPGQTVPGGILIINDTSSIRGWGAGKVSWMADGAMLGYNMRTCSGVNAIAAVPTYGSMGNALPVVPKARSCLHSWNPTLAGSNQYLYYSSDWFSDEAHGIFVNTVGNASGGTRLYHPPPLFFQMLDMEWLPDGSGFLLSMAYMSGWDPVYTCAGHDYHSCRNIFEYDLATHRVTQRTNIDDKSVNRLAVSPDGQHIIFERTTDPDFDPTSSLWIIDRDGTGLHKLLDDAGRPAWGKVSAAPPSTATPTATATPPPPGAPDRRRQPPRPGPPDQPPRPRPPPRAAGAKVYLPLVLKGFVAAPPTSTPTSTPAAAATATPTRTPTNTPTATPAHEGIHGRVTYRGAAAPDIPLRLIVYDESPRPSCRRRPRARTAATCSAASPPCRQAGATGCISGQTKPTTGTSPRGMGLTSPRTRRRPPQAAISTSRMRP